MMLQGVGQRSVRHEWGELGTASAALSQCERNTVPRGLQLRSKVHCGITHPSQVGGPGLLPRRSSCSSPLPPPSGCSCQTHTVPNSRVKSSYACSSSTGRGSGSSNHQWGAVAAAAMRCSSSS